MATKNVLISDVRDLERALEYTEERRSYWCGEAQRLALILHGLGYDPNTGEKQKVKY